MWQQTFCKYNYFCSSLSIVLVLDLSKPNALWETMEKLLGSARSQVEKVCAVLQKTGESRSSKQRVPRVLHKDYPVERMTQLI